MAEMRTFHTGATRDQDDTKPSYRGFQCPLVQRRYGEYMLEHQRQADGTKRAPDNWKKGIPSIEYLDSLLRHVQELWEMFEFQRPVQDPPHSSIDWAPEDIKRYEDALAAILFNTNGLMRNSLMGRGYEVRPAGQFVQPLDTLRDLKTGEVLKVEQAAGWDLAAAVLQPTCKVTDRCCRHGFKLGNGRLNWCCVHPEAWEMGPGQKERS